MDFAQTCCCIFGKSFLDLPNEFDEKGIEKFRELYGESCNCYIKKGTLYIFG